MFPSVLLRFVSRCTAALALCVIASGSASAAPQLRLQMQPPPYLDTDSIGSNGEGQIGFGFLLLNGETAQAPFTLRMQLPQHVTYRSFNGGQWSCGAVGQQVTCSYPLTLTAANWQSASLGIYVDVDGDLPVPGSSLLRATLESAQVPLPDPLVCQDVPSFNVATSDTGCVERVVAHRQSQVVLLPETWGHNLAVFEAGATLQTFNVGFSNIGFGQLHTPVTARFQLPPGFLYQSVFGQVVWSCSAAVPDAQGQLVTCTTPYFFDGMGPQQANIGLRVNVAPDVAVPGPLPIYATISNPDQPPPDFALCDDASPPTGCGYYTIPTRAARLSRMDILSMQPSQPQFDQGQAAQVTIGYSNIGEGNATAATLTFALPAGFGYSHHTASPPLNCTVTAGTPASGQTLACRYAATYPAGINGLLNLFLSVLPAAPVQSLLIGSASDDGRPGPTLAECIADPASPEPMVGCGRTVLRVSPWIFCNGFERLARICGQPQPF